MFVEAFPESLPLYLCYFSLEGDPNLEFYLRIEIFYKSLQEIAND
jgi:hypothetical protein